MHTVFAVRIGPQQRAHKQHGRSCGAHPACQHGSYGKNPQIHWRRTREGALKAYPARNRVQRKKEYKEGHVIQQDDVAEFIEGHAGAIDSHAWDKKGERPENGNLASVMFPENMGGQRQYGYGKQHARKRDDPPCGEGAGNCKMVGGGKSRVGSKQQCAQSICREAE